MQTGGIKMVLVTRIETEVTINMRIVGHLLQNTRFVPLYAMYNFAKIYWEAFTKT